MAEHDVAATLRADTFLGSLPDDLFAALCARGRSARHARGDTLFARGDDGSSMLLITAGTVKISNTTAEGREAVLNFLGPGDVVGEITVLDGLPRTATATAVEPCETFALYRRDLLPALLAHPAAMKEIIDLLCAKLRLTSALVEDALNEMAGRTARGLLRLADQHGRHTREGILIPLRVNQRDLGAYMGLSRENASRQLGALRERGVVRIDAAGILIRDRDRLADEADAV